MLLLYRIITQDITKITLLIISKIPSIYILISSIVIEHKIKKIT
ncbi:hypothetical protein M141_2243 [Bacteroides fragilis str. S38L5]|nr:hypothetical protein M141_2243 [Bacteroides fragilis str. S38L5]EYB14425.1 hypothetical protein M140_2201 [Bacteroides fragilis str. S38L3]